MEKFHRGVIKQLKYYVYRLIDPRTGNTFYVGKGKGNRVFAHVLGALNGYKNHNYIRKDEDDISLKNKQIQEIHDAGLSVIHVIHRWGLEEDTAYEVEAALIDCYMGLTNVQAGHNSDRGIANAELLQRTLSKKIFDDTKAQKHEYIIIKIRQKVLEDNNENIYEAARKAWRVDIHKAQAYKYILVSLYGEIIAIFKNVKWKASIVENRSEFEAETVDKKIDRIIIKRYLHKRLPDRYMRKGISNPVLYQSREIKRIK